MTYFVIFFTLGETVVLIVLISMNLDPFYFYVVLARQIDFGFHNNLTFIILLHTSRFFVTFFLWQWLFVGIKATILIQFTSATIHLFLNLLI